MNVDRAKLHTIDYFLQFFCISGSEPIHGMYPACGPFY